MSLVRIQIFVSQFRNVVLEFAPVLFRIGLRFTSNVTVRGHSYQAHTRCGVYIGDDGGV